MLATNVAETSLTVPGIGYVIDAGTARVKRYSYRNKVEQLLVEPVSQAAANQRAGRCGRVSNGVCIRLYEEADFAKRPRFTDPEVLRSSLAGVILRMKALGLGSVEDFPFLDAPPRRAIADGYQLLAELGAVDDANALTAIGREARSCRSIRGRPMILEARKREALKSAVIASAISGRTCAIAARASQAADQAHKNSTRKSEFVSALNLGSGSRPAVARKARQALQSQAGAVARDHSSPRAESVSGAKFNRNPHRVASTAGGNGTREIRTTTCRAAGLPVNVVEERRRVVPRARGIRFYRHRARTCRRSPVAGRRRRVVETTSYGRASPRSSRNGCRIAAT